MQNKPLCAEASSDQLQNFESPARGPAHARLQSYEVIHDEQNWTRHFLAAVCFWMAFSLVPYAQAQQTLGGITGTVTDKTGGVLPETVVTIVGDQTKLTRSQKTNANGSYDFVSLPIGTYTSLSRTTASRRRRVPSDHGAGRSHSHNQRRAANRAGRDGDRGPGNAR